MRCLMRISLPDRPGALGAVARALGETGSDIRSLDVVEVGDGIAVDDLVLDAGHDDLDGLRREVERLEGVIVEMLRPAGPAARRSPLALAAAMGEAVGRAADALVSGLPSALPATWCAVVRERDPQPEVLAASPGTPSFVNVETPWFPLLGARRLESAVWMPPGWRMGSGYVVAAAPHGDPREAVVIARSFGPRFRGSELEQLASLARLSAALERAGAVTG